MNDKLRDLLMREEPKGLVEERTGPRPFKPSFNVREEFPIWIREEFPDLATHAKKRRVYQALEDRREEVYEAALGVLTHGVYSTNDCARAKLSKGWRAFRQGFEGDAKPIHRARSLAAYIEALEDLSISLGGDKHFTECGTSLSGERAWSGKKSTAFVYRIGEEHGTNTLYTVREEPHKIEGAVLIGELTDLWEYDLKRLYREADQFKGPEETFIAFIDSIIPEPGSYRGRYDQSPVLYPESQDTYPESQGYGKNYSPVEYLGGAKVFGRAWPLPNEGEQKSGGTE